MEILKSAQSETIAKKAQIEQHVEFKYKTQVKKLEEQLSKMKIDHLTVEDEFQQKQKSEQERADKYRAKYESVKQHVKTLEMQKVEYTRVNIQLRQQNNQFRGMITQLQNQLKMMSGQQNGAMPMPQQNKLNNVPPPGPRPMMQQNSNLSNNSQQNNNPNINDNNPMKQQLLQLQQQQQNLIRQQNMLRAQQEQNKNGG